jgi:hypothetical protein
MGKPFDSELQKLEGTLQWAFKDVLPHLAPWSVEICSPAYCVGSGGSQSAADFLARLIRGRGGYAWATTPLEYHNLSRPTSKSSTFLLSAGGSNKDILSVAELAQSWESNYVCALTTRSHTPLATQVLSYSRGSIVELPIPCGKDGFLATNSLIAMMVALPALMGVSHGDLESRSLQETAAMVAGIQDPPHPVTADDEIIIIYAGWAGPAAMDLESKLSEAALAPSMLCDLRSFGHGRHNWIAKRSKKTVVVALVDGEHEGLFKKTLSLLPADVRVIYVRSVLNGPWATVDLTLRVLGLVRTFGTASGIDPGRPGIPDFGRKLYHLSPKARSTKHASSTEIAVERRIAGLPGHSKELRDKLESAVLQFKERLKGAQIRSIVFDYDGTLVDTYKRFEALSDPVIRELTRILGLGLTIGIATGRGKSVRGHLRSAIPKSQWASVLVGYYNGGDIIALDDDRLPDRSAPSSGDLADFQDFALSDLWLASQAIMEARPRQLSITSPKCHNEVLCRHVLRLLSEFGSDHLKCFMSSHSVDVLPKDVSKLALIRQCMVRAACTSDQILTIGDSGLWPGNDSELLSHFPSLSCGSSYSRPTTGWNLAPSGMTECSATVFYLEHISMRDELGLGIHLS